MPKSHNTASFTSAFRPTKRARTDRDIAVVTPLPFLLSESSNDNNNNSNSNVNDNDDEGSFASHWDVLSMRPSADKLLMPRRAEGKVRVHFREAAQKIWEMLDTDHARINPHGDFTLSLFDSQDALHFTEKQGVVYLKIDDGKIGSTMAIRKRHKKSTANDGVAPSRRRLTMLQLPRRWINKRKLLWTN